MKLASQIIKYGNKMQIIGTINCQHKIKNKKAPEKGLFESLLRLI